MSDPNTTRHGAPADASIGSNVTGARFSREGRPTGPVPKVDRRSKVQTSISPKVVREPYVLLKQLSS